MGPNHYRLKDGGVICSICENKNPLGNLVKFAVGDVNVIYEIVVVFTQGGTHAHALHRDGRTVLGPWTKFASADVLDRAMVYIGATDAQMTEHRAAMPSWGQGSTRVRFLPLRKNLLKVDWSKLG
jgi:hypothetical protein